MVAACAVLCVAVLAFAGSAQGHEKLIVHTSQGGNAHATNLHHSVHSELPPAVHPGSHHKLVVPRHLMDLTQNVEEPVEDIPANKGVDLEQRDVTDLTSLVQDIPEQTLPDENDVASRADVIHGSQWLVEIPEQTVGDPNADLEKEDDAEEDEDDDKADAQAAASDPTRRLEEIPEQNIEANAPDTEIDLEEDERATVLSRQPKVKGGIQAGNHWLPNGQYLTDNLPENFVNPMLMNHDPGSQGTADSTSHGVYDPDDETLHVDSGGFHFEVQHNHAKNYLDADRVQVGTSELGAFTSLETGNGQVAKYRIRFSQRFKKRPIVFVTTAPTSGSREGVTGGHFDTFTASVSEVRLDQFTVNVIRVDTFPNNGWGQSLHLNWIALEYGDVVQEHGPPEYNSAWLETRPRHDLGEQTHVASATTRTRHPEADKRRAKFSSV